MRRKWWDVRIAVLAVDLLIIQCYWIRYCNVVLQSTLTMFPSIMLPSTMLPREVSPRRQLPDRRDATGRRRGSRRMGS